MRNDVCFPERVLSAIQKWGRVYIDAADVALWLHEAAQASADKTAQQTLRIAADQFAKVAKP